LEPSEPSTDKKDKTIYASISPEIYDAFMAKCLDIKEAETGIRAMQMGDLKRFVQIALRDWTLKP